MSTHGQVIDVKITSSNYKKVEDSVVDSDDEKAKYLEQWFSQQRSKYTKNVILKSTGDDKIR